MTVDGHRHFTLGQSDPAVLLKELEADGIAKTVLFGYHGLSFGCEAHAQDVAVRELARRNPGRFLPFCCDFDLFGEDAVEYVEDRLGGDGFVGLGELLVCHTPIRSRSFGTRSMLDRGFMKCCRAAGTFGKPVLFHADPAFREQAVEAVSRCPETAFIWAHTAYDFCRDYGGGPCDPSLVRGLLERHPNLSFDISSWKISPLHLFEKPWLELLEGYSDRFIFGSDMTGDYSLERVWLPAYWELKQRLSPKARENVFGGTILRLTTGVLPASGREAGRA
jgi:predicted TIM-barrel fold metal-dependent hydrolase